MENLLEPLIRVLWVATLVAQVAVLARLFQERLIKRYPFFVLYLSAETAFGLIGVWIDFRSPVFTWIFNLSSAVTLPLELLVACEIWNKICEHFPGIGVFRFSVTAVLAITSWGFALIQTPADLMSGFPQTLALTAKRFQSEVTAAVFLGLWVFFRWIVKKDETRWRQNVLWHWRIATVYFAIGGITSLGVLLSGGGRAVYPINCAMLLGDLACLSLWFAYIRAEGEAITPPAYMSDREIAWIKQRDRDLVRTVAGLPGEISQQLTKSRAPRRATWR